jgi:hypothetical protein
MMIKTWIFLFSHWCTGWTQGLEPDSSPKIWFIQRELSSGRRLQWNTEKHISILVSEFLKKWKFNLSYHPPLGTCTATNIQLEFSRSQSQYWLRGGPHLQPVRSKHCIRGCLFESGRRHSTVIHWFLFFLLSPSSCLLCIHLPPRDI